MLKCVTKRIPLGYLPYLLYIDPFDYLGRYIYGPFGVPMSIPRSTGGVLRENRGR